MERDAQRPEADVFIGAIRWQGGASPGDDSHAAEAADVIRLAPYLLARRGRAVARE